MKSQTQEDLSHTTDKQVCATNTHIFSFLAECCICSKGENLKVAEKPLILIQQNENVRKRTFILFFLSVDNLKIDVGWNQRFSRDLTLATDAKDIKPMKY